MQSSCIGDAAGAVEAHETVGDYHWDCWGAVAVPAAGAAAEGVLYGWAGLVAVTVRQWDDCLRLRLR